MADIKSDLTSIMRYYGQYQRDGVHLSLNQRFFDTTGSCNGACVKTFAEKWMFNLPPGKWANWLVSELT